MKKNYTLLLLLFAAFAFSQAPPNYYNNATGTGYTLKTQLRNIITNGHSDQGYNSLWNLYTESAFRDNYYEDDNTVLDIYSENPTSADPYNYTSTSDQCGNYNGEGDCYNREHLVAQSYFDEGSPMKNDPFHVVPSDGSVNGARGNFPFGEVGTASYTSQNGSKKGSMASSSFSSFTGTVFEPIDAFKGDVARSFFYFATRYETQMAGFYTAANVATTQVKSMFDGTNNKVFSDNFLLLLIKWHIEDPVSQKEIDQNNAIYDYQGNRNPYIDNPDYVCDIWTTQCATVEALLGTKQFDTLANVMVYPNPSNNNRININSEVILDEIQLINVNGQIMQEIKNPNSSNNVYTLENLSQGFYFLRLSSDTQTITKKVIIN
ncbi:endonuclease [Flavobacterium soli]|uniref:endonuclease n=1 Tax=Flavobacterium soli TaxID=344881 RepID=UPI00047939A9|nr:endonuclease [Flavobacterium soli]